MAEINKNLAAILKPKWYERALIPIAPGRARSMYRTRTSLSLGGYIGARYDRNATKFFNPITSTADDLVSADLPTLRERSRDLVRNTPLATGALNTVCQKVAGGGLRLQSRPDGDVLGWTADKTGEFSRKVESEFALWADTPECDITRTQNFYEQQELVFRSALEAGDVFALTPMIARKTSPYKTVLQVIEADRVTNPANHIIDTATMHMGIDFDQYGAPVGYHVRKFHPASTEGIADTSETVVPAFGAQTGRRNVLHLFKRLRPGQSRGVPYLAPVIEPLKQLDRYTEAEVMAAVVSAMFTVFVTTPQGEGFSFDTGTSGPAGGSGVTNAAEVRLGSGSIVDLMPGEKPEFANPTRPNSNFDPFLQAVLRQIGVALGIPFEVLIKHFTASYSAARAALLEAWEFFNNQRQWLTNQFCQPAFEIWFEEAVAINRIDAPGFFDDPAMRRAYLQTEWIGSVPQSLDPEKDANAATIRLNNRTSTLEDECQALNGKSWEDQHHQQVIEFEAQKRDGLLPAPTPTPAPGAPKSTAPSGGNDTQTPDTVPPKQGGNQ